MEPADSQAPREDLGGELLLHPECAMASVSILWVAAASRKTTAGLVRAAANKTAASTNRRDSVPS